MKFLLREDRKHLMIFLTNSEKNDPSTTEYLNRVIKKYSSLKYLVAVCESGNTPLYESFRNLALHHRKKMIAIASSAEH